MSYQVQGNNIIDDNGNINAGIITATQYRGNVVTRLVAGSGILLQPASGIGDVTVINTGGGGGGGGGAPGIIQMDNIASQFNGVQTQFAILIGGNNPAPLPTTGGVIISVDGVIQTPNDSFNVTQSGGVAYVNFTQAPTAGMQFSGYVIDLQVATPLVPGVVKPDNTTITITPDGTITSIGGSGGGGPLGLEKLDNIAFGFDGSTTQFPLRINGTSVASNVTSDNLIISLGGVLQDPFFTYSVISIGSSAFINFFEPPSFGLSFVGYLGSGSAVNTAGGAPGIIVMDDISSQFNGVQTQFAIKISTNDPEPLPTTTGVLVSVDGVIQVPNDSYVVTQAGGVAYITFSQAPTAGMKFAGFVIDLQIATPTVPGVVKPDNTTITISNDGTITAVGGGGGGSGTVTSVNVAGGTSGLTFTGGPVTTTGTITLTGGVLSPTFGGTGTTTGAVTQVIAGAGLTASTAGSVITLALDISSLPALP